MRRKVKMAVLALVADPHSEQEEVAVLMPQQAQDQTGLLRLVVMEALGRFQP
jgi:hypothetical protein